MEASHTASHSVPRWRSSAAPPFPNFRPRVTQKSKVRSAIEHVSLYSGPTTSETCGGVGLRGAETWCYARHTPNLRAIVRLQGARVPQILLPLGLYAAPA